MTMDARSQNKGSLGRVLLPRNQVDLWITDLTDGLDPVLLERYSRLLSKEERQRQVRFLFERDRRRQLVTRATVRLCLSRYASVEPQDWQFRENLFGKPFVHQQMNSVGDWLDFSVSHSGNLVVLAVGRQTLGVDVVDTRCKAPLEVMSQCFSPDEIHALEQLPSIARATRFFELWTLKESYIKALGVGMSIPLKSFSFRLDPQGSLNFRLETGPEAERAWQFELVEPDGSHMIALCARSTGPLHVRYAKWVPLLFESLVDPKLRYKTQQTLRPAHY